MAAGKAAATLVGSVRRVGLDVELRDVADRVDLVVPEGAAIVGLPGRDPLDPVDLPGRVLRGSREAGDRVRLAPGVVDRGKVKAKGLLEVGVPALVGIVIVVRNRLPCRCRS